MPRATAFPHRLDRFCCQPRSTRCVPEEQSTAGFHKGIIAAREQAATGLTFLNRIGHIDRHVKTNQGRSVRLSSVAPTEQFGNGAARPLPSDDEEPSCGT